MNKILLFISLFFISSNLPAQISFERIYNFSNYNCDAHAIITDSSVNLIIIGTEYKFPGFVRIMKLNNFGDTIWTQTIIDSSFYTQGAAYGDKGLVLLSGNTFAMCGTRQNLQTDKLEGYYCKFDSSGNLLNQAFWTGPQDYYFSSLIRLADGNLLLSGQTINPVDSNTCFCAIKIDEAGNQLWSNFYPGNSDERSWSAFELPNKDIVLAGDKKASPLYNNKIIRIDSLGNYIWSRSWTYLGYYNCGLTGINIMPNGDYIVSGGCEFNNKSKAYTARMIPVGVGVFAWQKVYGSSHAYYFDGRPEILDGGCILNVGTGADTAGINFIHGMAMLISDSGDSLWSSLFTHHQRSDQFYDMEIIDSGYVFTGYTRDTIAGQSAWVVKIPSSVIPVCDSLTQVDELETANLTMKIFPNPFEDRIMVVTGIDRQMKFTLYDNLSKKVLEKFIYNNEQIDLQFLPPGLYIFEIIDEERSMKRGKIIKS